MKNLNFSRLCLVGALILGLMFAWANAAPKVTSGDIFGGANCGCKRDLSKDCSVYGCNGILAQCHNTGSGVWDCVDNKSDTCTGDPGCRDHTGKKCA